MEGNLTFEKVPERATNVRHIGSLIFDLRSDLGDTALLDLTSEPVYVMLARDCIAALYEHCRPGRISSDLTIHSYSNAIREILTYCGEKAFAPTFRLSNFSFDHLLDYRTHLNIRFASQKITVRRRKFGNLLRLFEAAQAISLAPPEFSTPRNFAFVRDGDRVQPYPAGELLDLEDACRTHIRELAARIELGKQLLAEGVDPRKSGHIPGTKREKRWDKLPNMIWYAVNVLEGRYLKRSELLAGHSSFNSSLMGSFGGSYRKPDVYSHLYPFAEDLIPFVLLLAKTTGRNESSILCLRRDCIKEINGHHFLWYEKRRGAAASYKKPIANDGPFSPVQLIRNLLELTKPLVHLADKDDQNLIFIGLSIANHGGNPIKSLDPSYVK